MEQEEKKKTKFWLNKEYHDTLEFLHKLVFAVGIPISIYTFLYTHHVETENHQISVYDNTDRKFWEYEMLAMKYPHLGLTEASNTDVKLKHLIKPDSALTSEDKAIARDILNLLISMYERAYIIYSDESSEFKKRQWAGWKIGLNRWLKNEKFISAWKNNGQDYDTEFQKYVNGLFQSSH